MQWKKMGDESPQNNTHIIFTDITEELRGTGYYLDEDKDEWNPDFYWMYFPKLEINK